MDVSAGTRLRVLRKDAGLTQAQLAAPAGTNQAAIHRYDSASYKRILKNNRVHVVPVTEPVSHTPEGIMRESLEEVLDSFLDGKGLPKEPS